MANEIISLLHKILSYVYPITYKINSEHNGVLEITYINGKKTLNTQNTNYSFGNLHKVMRFALKRIDINENKKILLLGIGGGSAINIIRQECLLNNAIDAVDIDPEVIAISKKEFGLADYLNITIHCQDAYTFVNDTKKKYGLIIIGLFLDRYTPESFYETHFWTSIIRLTKKRNYIIFNTLEVNNTPYKIKHIETMLKNAGFTVFIYEKVAVSNLVIIAKRI